MFRGLQGLRSSKFFWCNFGGVSGGSLASKPSRRFAAARGQDPPSRASWRQAKNVGVTVEGLGGFGVFPSRGKSMYIVYIWPTGVAGSRAVPPDVREEPGGLYTSILHRLLPLSYPVRVYRLTCIFSV